MKVEITRWKTNSKYDKWRKGSVKKCVVEVGYGDEWNADWTIATIVLPLLKKLKEKKQGAPFVDEGDVPEHLRPLGSVSKDDPNFPWKDENFFKRWEYALDEMIFAMQEIANDNENEPPYHTKQGEMLFGEIDAVTGFGEITFEGWETTPESVAANKAYHERIRKGCMLFGKYFQSLWS